MAESAKSVGGYSLQKKVRTGPHLAVFASEDSLGRQIEISCYRASSLRAWMGREAFLTEARQTAELHHENLCPMINAGEEEGIWFAISVAPDAPSLRDLLDRGGALATERILVVAERILAALEHLHKAGLRHGDIRPETVFLSGAKVLLAPRRLIPLAPAERDLRYLAPEEIQAEGTDIRADLFAFGIVLFETLTGKAPTAATEIAGRLMEIEAGPPDLPDGLPEGLWRLTIGLLAPTPDARPATPALAAGLIGGVSPGPADPLAPPSAADLAPPSATDLPRPAKAVPAPPRRRPGAFTWERNGEKAYYEVVEDRLHLSIARNLPVFSEKKPKKCLARIEDGSILAEDGADPHPRVNGSLIDRHELTSGDVIALGGLKLSWGPIRADHRRIPPGTQKRQRGRRAAILISFLLSIAVVGWGVTRILKALESGWEVIAAAAETEERLDRETNKLAFGSAAPRAPGYTDKAKEAFEAAQDFARTKPEAFDEIEKHFKRVRKLYGPTAYAYLAQKELDDNRARRREAEVREFESMNQEVASAIEDDRLYDGVAMLENYAEHHEGTRFGVRAERESINLLETIAARFDEDMLRADQAVERGEFGIALDILSVVRRYAGPDERSKAERRVKDIRQRIHETQVPGGEPAVPSNPGGEGPPDKPGPDKADVPAGDPIAAKKASNILERIRKAFEREKWDEVLKLLDDLEVYAETAVVKGAQRDLDRMRGLARLEALGVAALFNGRTKIIKGLEVEITYDFSTKEQAKDWFYSTPFAHPLSGSFWVDHEALHGRGVGAAVHPGEFESDTLLLKARVRALEPHDFGFLMLEPEEQVNYFLYAAQNRFFVIKLDRPVHENSLWVVGTGAWADTPDGFLGMVRKNGSPDPAITAGEWLTLEAKKQKGSMSLVIKGKEIKGAAKGDNNYVFPGLQPAVYVVTGNAMFDDIVIRGTLKKEWVEDRMRFLKRQLTK